MLKLPMIFGNNMVLQRQKPMEIWGEADPNASVAVELCRGGETLDRTEAFADSGGAWRAFLPAREAARGLELVIRAGGDTVTIHDVLIGEVWIAGGQSNMEYFLQFDAEREMAFTRPEDPDIRFFDYPEISYEGELEEYDFSEFGLWRRCRREDLPWYSAVGYWFAEKLKGGIGIPVGIVGCNWGGTRACCWMDRARLEGTPGEVWLRDYEEGIKGVDPADYRRAFCSVPNNINDHPVFGRDTSIYYPGFTREQQLNALAVMENMPRPPYVDIIGPDHPWRPCGLYGTMLKKIVPYTCRGIIWYQGESDELHPEIYDQMMALLIGSWRELWHDELPFLMVQLAPFGAWMGCGSDAYPTLRDRQERVARTVPSVWLASSSDVGMRWDIHPKHKRPIGERLALLALGHVYGHDILCEAPSFESARWENGTLTVTFRHADGLTLKSADGKTVSAGPVNDLLVDGKPVEGRIEADRLVIPAPEKPKRMELAQCGYYEVNLYNRAGIPAKPFAADPL